ncbi:hypothetical protein HYALB_00006367 [Hymenoscyphus albidus]|uniref:Uncharacterized protein n=1 Tax=Hymenoscyphus albidus TaxID=595503 RepID=A0A9N9PS53_9HELO|nr:hypothetical protein HYALB_00006367 [Hymenoscyphus albidus]
MYRGTGASPPRSRGSPDKPRPVKMPRPQPLAGACTHLTVTRYYTTHYRCCICTRLGSFGWLYRCTQDRELMLEENNKRLGSTDEGISAMLGRSEIPLRSPAARHDKLAFLSELTPEPFASYSEEQVNKILDQRAHILEVAFAQSQPITPEIIVTPPSPPNQPGSSRDPPTRALTPPPNYPDKPWLNMTGGECQFKCCHRCRSGLYERSYLSLDGIAKNDIPMTALTGFGFHTREHMPYSHPEHVKNLGLRPNPVPRASVPPMIPRRAYTLIQDSDSDSDVEMTDAPPLNPTLPRTPRPKSWTITNNPSSRSSTDFATEGRKILTDFLNKLTAEPSPSSSDHSLATLQKYTNKPLPTLPTVPANQTLKSNTLQNTATPHPGPLTSNPPPHIIRPKPRRSNLSLAVAISTPLPVDEDEDEDFKPLTLMEKQEAHEGAGVFSSKPLEVGDGVAFMEEGLEGHFADLMDIEVEGSGKEKGIDGETLNGEEMDVKEDGEVREGESVGSGSGSGGLESIMTQV